MQTLTDPRQRCKTCSDGLERERIEQFLAYLARHEIISLDAEGYRLLKLEGLTMRQVDRAVSILRAQGCVQVKVSSWGLSVEIPGEGVAPCPTLSL